MGILISASIDLSKINKDKIKDVSGKKYYDITILVNDTLDKFNNDVAITEGQTKDERTAKAKKNYLGNGKTIWNNESRKNAKDLAVPAAEAQKSSEAAPPANDEHDDLPF